MSARTTSEKKMRFPVFFMWTPQLGLNEFRHQLQQRHLWHGASRASQPESRDGHDVPFALLMGNTAQGPLQLPPFRIQRAPATRLSRDATRVSQPELRACNCIAPAKRRSIHAPPEGRSARGASACNRQPKRGLCDSSQCSRAVSGRD